MTTESEAAATPRVPGAGQGLRRERPISPLLSVYRLRRYTTATSLSHRFTGLVLSTGLVLLVYWLMSVAGGARAFARAYQVLSFPLLKVVYAILLIVFIFHLIAGIRHLVFDTIHGLERKQAQHSAWFIFALAAVLILLAGYFAFFA